MRFGKKFIFIISIMLAFVLSFGMSVSAALSPGEKNSSVTEMQKKLIALGYLSGTAGGTYNTATKNAVKTFETLNGLSADGIADDEMLAKLDRVYGGAANFVVTSSSVNVRSGAGTRYSKLGAVKKNASYIVLGSKKVSGVTWYSFRYGKKTGWISGKYVKYNAAQSYITTAKTATITASSLNVRSGAGTKYSKVTSLKKGKVVKITGSKKASGKTWYSYSSGGRTLWFSGSYATIKSYIAEKPETSTTTTTTTTVTTTTTTTAAKNSSVFTHSSAYKSSAYYTALCNLELTGNLRNDIASVALSQVGYHEGDSASDTSGSSNGTGNYTEYGVNYGTASDSWCSMFIWWCARQAGVKETIIPKTEWAKVITYGLDYKAFGADMGLRKGDLLFIENTGDSYEDHIALVVDVNDSSVTTVEGNTSNRVATRIYSLADGKSTSDDARIMYAAYPDYEGQNADKTSYQTAFIVLSDSTDHYSKPDGTVKGTLSAGEYLLLNESEVSGTVWYRVAAGLNAYWVKAGEKAYLDRRPITSYDTTAPTTTATTTTTTVATTTATEATTTTTATTTAADSTQPQKITTKVQFATVKSSSLNLRKGAGTSYAKVATASKGSKYAVLGSKTVSGVKWYKLLYKGKAVWASGSYLTISTKTSTVNRVDVSAYITDKPRHLSKTAVINNEADILYSQPGTSSTPLLILQKGVIYDVYGDKGDSGGTTWYKLNVNGVEGYISRKNVTVTNHYDQIADRDFSEKTPVIYLSPSKQGGNPYITGNTSEKAEMEALGDIIAKKLEKYDCVVYIAPKTMSLYDRAQHAYSLKADIYIAIHSNATGNSSVSYGPSAYYFPGCAQSREYAQSIVNSLNKIAPKGENLSVQVINGMNLAGGFGYAEVREPGTLGMIGVLVETDYHDYKPTAQWLIKNKDEIADAYVESLVNAFGLKLREEHAVTESPADIVTEASQEPEPTVVITPTDAVIPVETVSTTDAVSPTDTVSTADAA